MFTAVRALVFMILLCCICSSNWCISREKWFCLVLMFCSPVYVMLLVVMFCFIFSFSSCEGHRWVVVCLACVSLCVLSPLPKSKTKSDFCRCLLTNQIMGKVLGSLWATCSVQVEFYIIQSNALQSCLYNFIFSLAVNSSNFLFLLTIHIAQPCSNCTTFPEM